MARQERPVDPAAGPLQSFAHDLRQVRARAGNPTYRALARTAGYSATTLSEAARGVRKPTLEVVLAYVGACKGDVAAWRQRWEELDAVPDGQPRPQPTPCGQPPRAPGRRFRWMIAFGSAALLVAATAVVAGWLAGGRSVPAENTLSCPTLPSHPAFTGVTYGSGAPVRTGASTGAQLVSTVPSNCTLGFTGFCIGEQVVDATSGTADVRWFMLADGNVVPSAVIHGNPPVASPPSRCRNDRPGPEDIELALTADPAEPGAIRAQARGSNVDIAGFAAWYAADAARPGAARWQQLGLAGGADLGSTWRGGSSPGPAATGRLVVVAVACLGGGGPTDVVDVKAVRLDKRPGTAYQLRLPDRELAAAARTACRYPSRR